MTAYLCDSNVWLALAVSGHTHHEGAAAWFSDVISPASVHFCRSTQQSLLRLLSSGRMLAQYDRTPLTNAEAWGAYSEFLTDDRVVFAAEEPAGVERWWIEFASRPTSSPNVWMDAYLAAFARAASLQLVTFDRAFRQFEGLDVLILEDVARPSQEPAGA